MSGFITNPMEGFRTSYEIVRETTEGPASVGNLCGRLCSMIVPFGRSFTPPILGCLSGAAALYTGGNASGAATIAISTMLLAKSYIFIIETCCEPGQYVAENAAQNAGMQEVIQQNADVEVGIAQVVEQVVEEVKDIQEEIEMVDATASNLEHPFADGSA